MKNKALKIRSGKVLKICVGLCELFLFTMLMMNLAVSVSIFNKVGENVDITKDNDPFNRQQVEPTIAIDPTNPDIIVAGAQDLRGVPEYGDRWHGYYRSVDGGLTWTSTLLPGFPTDTSEQGLASPIHVYDFTSDPVLAIDNMGNVFYLGIAVKWAQFQDAIFVAKYTNHGETYDSTVIVYASNEKFKFLDKPWIAVDTSGGKYDENIYVAWSAFTGWAGTEQIMFSRSTDHGVTFSEPQVISRPPNVSNFNLWTVITVAPNGDVYVAWDSFTWTPRGFKKFSIIMTKSTDGGKNFGPRIKVHEVVPLPIPLPNNQFRVLSLPTIGADESGVYIAWDDFRTGDADILFSRSTDEGFTWSAPIQVNDVTTNHQFFPAMSVSNGSIHIVFYDSRNDPHGQLLDVYYAQSIDGGLSFQANLRITEVSFDPNIVPRTVQPGAAFPFIGDYIYISSTATEAHVIWTDNRNAELTADDNTGRLDQDVFTAKITHTNS